MLSINWSPPTKQLKSFAALWFPLFFLFLGTILAINLNAWSETKIVWAFCFGISFVGYFFPSLIRPLFVGLLVITFPIGWVVSHLFLLLIFSLVITPLGFVMKIKKHDPLNLKMPKEPSMWKEIEAKKDPSRYLKQY